MKVLITGAAGFVASSLIDFFGQNDKNISLTCIDDFSYGYINKRIKDLDFRFIPKDLINKEVTKYSEANIDKLINLIGFKPKVSIEDGLNECYEYALK